MAIVENDQQLAKMAGELITLQPTYERYLELQRKLKRGMHTKGIDQIQCEHGDVSLVVADQALADADGARAALGDELAGKVFFLKASVCNKLLAALAEIGGLGYSEMGELMDGADGLPIVGLRIKAGN